MSGQPHTGSAGSTENGTLYWLWLQERIGVGSRYLRPVLDQPGRARFIYERTQNDLWALGIFPPGVIARLCDKSLDVAKRILDRCRRLGISVLTPDDRLYPRRLTNISDPPAVLFCSGSLPNLDSELCLAVVGTRTASAYGAALAQELAERMTEAGCLIISGAARGIDTAAHQGALLCSGGKTVAVLGCGINYRYNMAGASLREIIAMNGALISEYPPDVSPSVHTFPIRNRIISGLSLGVVVVEAGTVSGSINTAHHALNQSRDVFAISPSIVPVNSDGVKKLIDDGAISVETPMDILEQYADIFAQKYNITPSCSLPFMNEHPRGTFTASLKDVFSRFTYVFGDQHYSMLTNSGVYSGGSGKKLDDYNECFYENMAGRRNEDQTSLYYDDLKIGGGFIEADADSALDKLYGHFIPSWRIPAPGLIGSIDKDGDADSVYDPAEAAGSVPDTAARDESVPARRTRKKNTPGPVLPEPPEAFGLSMDEELSDDAKKLLQYLSDEPVTADLLAFRSGLSSAKALSVITELELYGLVTAHTGKRYALSK